MHKLACAYLNAMHARKVWLLSRPIVYSSADHWMQVKYNHHHWMQEETDMIDGPIIIVCAFINGHFCQSDFSPSHGAFYFFPNLWIDSRCFKLDLDSSPTWVWDVRICSKFLVFENLRWQTWRDPFTAKWMNNKVYSTTSTSDLLNASRWSLRGLYVRWCINHPTFEIN